MPFCSRARKIPLTRSNELDQRDLRTAFAVILLPTTAHRGITPAFISLTSFRSARVSDGIMHPANIPVKRFLRFPLDSFRNILYRLFQQVSRSRSAEPYQPGSLAPLGSCEWHLVPASRRGRGLQAKVVVSVANERELHLGHDGLHESRERIASADAPDSVTVAWFGVPLRTSELHFPKDSDTMTEAANVARNGRTKHGEAIWT